MKKIYSFCKKNKTLKKYYIPICEYLTQANIQEHEIVIGRHDEVVDKYTCYTTPCLYLYTKEKLSYLSKIKEICNEFDVLTKEWVCPDFSVELHGDNVELMLNTLNVLLSKEGYLS